MHEAHEGWERLFTSQGDATEAFEPIEETFDLVTLLVEAPVDLRLGGAAGIGLDLRGCAEIIGDEGAQGISVIGSIGNNMADALKAGQQRPGLRTVTMLPGCRMDADRQADRIDRGVQLGRQSAA